MKTFQNNCLLLFVLTVIKSQLLNTIIPRTLSQYFLNKIK